MSFATVLDITIPAVVIAYAVYIIIRTLKRGRRKCGGCAGCPYADCCEDARKKERKRDEH